MKAIEVKDLHRYYNGVKAVQGISFDVNDGEIFGFLGPNGAGKSTTIKVLTGQLRPTSGSAEVVGCDVVEDRQELKPQIGVVSNIRIFMNVYLREIIYNLPPGFTAQKKNVWMKCLNWWVSRTGRRSASRITPTA